MNRSIDAPQPERIAELLADLGPRRVERVAQGGSTWVYRVTLTGSVAYLRVLPEMGASFAPEALAHDLLMAAGVHVPAVLGWEHENAGLGASTMLTAEVPGRALAEVAEAVDQASVLRAAGRDLARLNRLLVDGFGWIDRSPRAESSLGGEHPSLHAWLEADLAAPLVALEAQHVLSRDDTAIIRSVVAELDRRCAREPAHLAHGDFDPTHIFVAHDRYAGLIDFGEIRGTHALYDLGYVAVNHRDLLPTLLDGYATVSLLPTDAARQIELTALVIATRRLGMRLLRRGTLDEPDLAALRRGLVTARDG